METHITPNDVPGVTVVAALLISSRERIVGNTLKREDRKIAVFDAIELVEEVQAEIAMRQPVDKDEEKEEQEQEQGEHSEHKPELVGDDDD